MNLQNKTIAFEFLLLAIALIITWFGVLINGLEYTGMIILVTLIIWELMFIVRIIRREVKDG
jgi:hypothetical protein